MDQLSGGRSGLAEFFGEEGGGGAAFHAEETGEGALVEEFAAAGAAVGAELHDPVGFRQEVEVVLDHDHRVALRDECVQHADEAFAVAQVQADGGLFEQVQVARRLAAFALGVAGQAAGELGDELEALRLAAAERGRALAERQVAESAVDHELAGLAELRVEIEEGDGFLEGELQHLADGFALPDDVAELGAVARAVAVVARQVGVGHEGHFEADAAGAVAGGAASAGGVERETRGGVAAQFGLGQAGEELADEVEDAEVGGRRGARRLADGRLVHLDDGAERVRAAQLGKRQWGVGRLGRKPGVAHEGLAGHAGGFLREGVADGRVQQIAEERGFAGAAGAGDHDEAAERQAQIEALQVAQARAGEL